jgi:ABC-type Zn uptake system ZnuABC Zn-binding protein ZnuA
MQINRSIELKLIPNFYKLTSLLMAVVGVLAMACANAPSSPTTPAAPTTASSSTQATPTTASPRVPDGPALNIVTTSNIVADWTRNVGGDRVEVFSLLPVNADPHTFQPGARDITHVADADLVLSVGLTLEADWFQELVENAASDTSRIVALGDVVDPIEFAEPEGHEEDIVEGLNDIVHEVEDREISPEDALATIEEMLGDEHGHDAEDEHEEGENHEGEGEEAELREEVGMLIHEAEEGNISAEDALEQIDALVEAHLDTHLGGELDEVIHHAEEEGEVANHILEELEAAIHEHEGHDHENEELETGILAIVHEVEEGSMSAQDAIDAIEALTEGHGHEEADDHAGDEHDHGQFDPHFWFDPLRVKRAVTDIASRLSVLDPAGSDMYKANARAYNERLDELHMWIQTQVSEVPEDRRLLLTSHDSFGYFAQAYGFEVVGAVIPGGSTARDPSAQEIADLVDRIRDANAPALFTETTLSNRLAQRIAEEASVEVVTELYTGSLGGPGSGAENYIDFMRSDVTAIVGALK